MSAPSKPPQEALGETMKLDTGPTMMDLKRLAEFEVEDVCRRAAEAKTEYPASLWEGRGAPQSPAPAHMLVANGTLTLAEAVARLYNSAGWECARKAEPVASADDAKVWIDEVEARGSAWLDYINHRPMKIDLVMLRNGSPHVFRGYDHCNGEGRGAAALRGET